MGLFDIFKKKKQNQDQSKDDVILNMERIESEIQEREDQEKQRIEEEKQELEKKQELEEVLEYEQQEKELEGNIKEKLEEETNQTEEQASKIKEEINEIEESTNEIEDNTNQVEEQTDEVEKQYENIKEDNKEIEANEEKLDEEEKNEIENDNLAEQEEKITEENSKSFFAKLVSGLTKTRQNIKESIDKVLKSFTKIDEELFEQLEETLIMADVGVDATLKIIDKLRKTVKEQKITEPGDLNKLLKQEIREILMKEEQLQEDTEQKQTVFLIIGVNGVGKTTTIGKLANYHKKQGKKVLLAAGDTFRAAAIEQLEEWGKRSGVDVIKHQENSDPAAVIFDAVQAAKARKTDVLICDTAGRLHNKKNLMEELRKIYKIINREFEQANKELLLVLDATTGQNALQQAKLFKEVVDINGIILTKLDGTAKGGIVIAIKQELDVPVKYIGVGEKIDDLQPFNSEEFINALFGE